jgi:hypothetical protein
MKVRLTKKFAEEIDGIDLSRVEVGDLLLLPRRDALLLVREGWATPFIEPADHADDRPRRRRTDDPEPAS